MQITFAEAEFTSKKKQTRRDRLLADLENLVSWSVLESVIESHYSKTDGKQSRPATVFFKLVVIFFALRSLFYFNFFCRVQGHGANGLAVTHRA